MARPARWNSLTVAIRVPAHAVEKLLELARILDRESFVQNSVTDPLMVTVDGTPYYFPPVEVTAEESDLLDRLIDELLAESDRLGIKERDRIVLIGEIAKRVGDPPRLTQRNGGDNGP